MNRRIYICLGLNGDILNLLPLLWSDAQAGNRSAIMVSREFAGLLDGVSYADCIPFDGTIFELERAHSEAAKLSNDVKVCQTAGPVDAVKKLAYAQIKSEHAVTDCFQKEAWKLAGRLSDWGKLPLVIDRRDPEREKQWIPKKRRGPQKPIMLVCTSGQTSPFPYKDLLMILLRLQFTNYNLIDISEFKCHRLYDLLGLFERAAVLVTTDSAPLHLARAVPSLPVVALVQDRPNLWHGSAWRPQHIAHIRYHDFTDEAVGMMYRIWEIGKPGSLFRTTLSEPRMLHVWTPSDVWSPDGNSKADEENLSAINSWLTEYREDNWVSCRLGIGAFGRDSMHSPLKDEKRLPFVKDMVRLARQMAGDDDVICLTRANFKFWPGIGKQILEKAPCYAHRSIEGQYHPAVDMFAFRKAWWDEHCKDYPEFVLGHDPFWNRVLWEIMKAHGGTELDIPA